MEDKYLITCGTIFLITFNFLVILIGKPVFASLGIVPGILYSIIFGGTALFFDYKVGQYFVNKIKEIKARKKDE